MSADAKADAVRLLRVIDAEQAHGRAGATVFAFAAARSAGLRPGTERYEEALTVNDHVPLDLAAKLPFGRAPYRLSPAATSMLQRA